MYFPDIAGRMQGQAHALKKVELIHYPGIEKSDAKKIFGVIANFFWVTH
jgi:hypothetical protein